MGLTNFRSEDFKGGNKVKVASSKRDRFASPTPTTKPLTAPGANPDDVPEGTVPEVMTWVGDDPVRAQKALDVELENDRPRKGLVNSLSEMVNEAANDGTAVSENDGTVAEDTTTAGDVDADTSDENVPDAPTNEPTSNRK